MGWKLSWRYYKRSSMVLDGRSIDPRKCKLWYRREFEIYTTQNCILPQSPMARITQVWLLQKIYHLYYQKINKKIKLNWLEWILWKLNKHYFISRAMEGVLLWEYVKLLAFCLLLTQNQICQQYIRFDTMIG